MKSGRGISSTEIANYGKDKRVDLPAVAKVEKTTAYNITTTLYTAYNYNVAEESQSNAVTWNSMILKTFLPRRKMKIIEISPR